MGTVPERVARWLPHARAAELQWGLDPLLILAICDRESGGGEFLHPRGPAGKGDNGHGHGLMQIDDRYHKTFLSALGPDGKPLWQKPPFNIGYASELLHFNIHQFDGAGINPLLAGAIGFNVSLQRIRATLRNVTKPIPDEQLVLLLDPLSTPSTPGGPGDYLSDVLGRRKSYVLTT